MEDMGEAVKLLNKAEECLDPGIGQPRTEEGVAKLREAASKLGEIHAVFMPTDVTKARAHARNLISRAERAARG